MRRPARVRLQATVAAAALGLGLGHGAPADAFTQSVGNGTINVVPMGHEWVTRMAAAEVLNYPLGSRPDVRDPNDPRVHWRPGAGAAWNISLNSPGAENVVREIKAKPVGENRYLSRFKAVYDAIVGERWVDLGGYNAIDAFSCWDAVAQEPAAIQYDHFMRRYDDDGGVGGVKAARTSQERFVAYFVAAATAAPMSISVYDGGASSDAVTVDRSFFLFGRAVHLFEDSFSPEHTVRLPADNFIQVRQVKSYICAPGSEQHSHSNKAIFNYTSGDVIWKSAIDPYPMSPTYTASNMKPVALVAVEATKDLWAAFIRSLGAPMDQRAAVARREAATLVEHWLSYNEPQMAAWYDDEAHRDPATYVLAVGQTGKGVTQTQCMKDLDKGTTDQRTYVRELEAKQRICLYNAVPWAGYADQADPQLHIWYSWRWLNGPALPMKEPPAGWRIPDLPADSGTQVRIASLANGKYMMVPDGIHADSLIYNRNGPPLDFVMVGPRDHAMFRSARDPLLFLDYRAGSGAVKLFAPGTAEPASYDLKPAGQGLSIRNLYWNQYFWLSGDEPYLTRKGDPRNPNAQWRFDGLR